FDAGAAFARTALVRISLADIADGGRFRFHAHLETGYFNLRVAQHCGTRAYWATNDTGDDTVRVYSVDEGVTAVTVNTVAVSSWNRSDFATSTPDGHDWLAAADDRLASASVRGNVLALAWNAGRGTGGSAFPGVAHVRIDLDTMLQTDADVLSSPTEAWAYPSLDWNADGELVVSAFAGGPGKPITSAAVTLTGEPAVTVSGVSSHGPTGEAWGAATCRQHPFFPKLWVWATWDLQGGGGDADAQPRYVLFGRSSDAPTLTGDLYEPDDSAAQARALTDRINQVRSIHTAGNADWAKFTMYGTAAVTITTTGGTEAAIFGPDDPTALRYSDPGTVSGTSLAVSLSAGDYWVRVREQGDDAALPTYTLSLRVAAVPDTYEPDDGVATASVLTPGSLQYHSIHTGGNEDWARFDLAERSSFVLQTDGPDRPYRNLDPANYDTELTLLAANGLTRLGGNDDMDSDQELRYSRLAGTLPAGTYYVRVRHSFETTGFMPLYSLLLTTGAPSDLRLTSPNGGESVNTGTSPTATWTSQRLGGNVKLEFSANRGDNWKTVVASTPNDGSEPWPVPIGGATTQGLLRVSAVGQVGLVDASDADFTVVEQRSITVLSPNSRFTTIPIGLATTISWTSFGVAGSVKLEYTVNGTDWVVIAAATENDGTAPWVTPLTLTTHARVRVTSLSAPVVSDTSDEEFTLGPPTLHLTSPNGGEILESQTLAEITWGTFGSAGGVKIEFSADSGTTWSVIHESVPDNGFKGWQIPPMATTRGRVRISSVLAPTSQDVSATDFTVLGSGAFSVPAVVKFPKTRTGKVKRKVVTLKNPSRFDDVAVTVGTPGAPFRLAEGGGSHLIPPRKSVKLILEFAPVEAGSHEAELVLTSSVQSRPVFRIALKGTAR
ncbi:MAG: hypothetical protein K0Q72_4606, partial [Armatimonadetes bacterium]|nr:hypothetical protein [Armatimonadota bacterium]